MYILLFSSRLLSKAVICSAKQNNLWPHKKCHKEQAFTGRKEKAIYKQPAILATPYAKQKIINKTIINAIIADFCVFQT